MEDNAASYDAGDDDNVYTRFGVGDEPRRSVNATKCNDFNMFWVHDRSFCGMVGLREIMAKGLEK